MENYFVFGKDLMNVIKNRDWNVKIRRLYDENKTNGFGGGFNSQKMTRVI